MTTRTSLCDTGLMEKLSFQFAALDHDFTRENILRLVSASVLAHWKTWQIIRRSHSLSVSASVCVFMRKVKHADDASRHVVINQFSLMKRFNLIRPLADKVALRGIR